MNLFKSLAEHGARLEDPLFATQLVNYLFDVEKGVLLPLPKHTSLLLPSPVGSRGSDAAKKPNLFWDAAQYVLTPKARFWEVVIEALRSCGDAEALEVVEKNLKRKWDITTKRPSTKLETFRLNGVETELKYDSWVVISIGTMPVVQRPKVFAWCGRSKDPSTDLQAGKIGTCLVTGEEGPLVNTHDKVNGIGGVKGSKAAFISYNEGATSYNGRKQGENFFVSKKTSRSQVVGLNALLARSDDGQPKSAVHLPGDCSMVFWPEGAVVNDVIPLAVKILGQQIKERSDLDAVWDAVRDLPDDDTTTIHVAMMKQMMARVSVRAYLTVRANELKQNLLKFGDEFGGSTLMRVAKIPGPKAGEFVPILQLPDFYDIFLAVVTGSPYPRAVLGLVMKINQTDNAEEVFDWVDRRILRWLDVYQDRINPPKENDMKRERDSKEEPTQDEFLNKNLLAKDDDVGVNQAYVIGCIAAIYGYLRIGAAGGAHRVRSNLKNELKRAQTSPQSYLTLTENAQVYIDKIQKQHWNMYLALLWLDFVGMFKGRQKPFPMNEQQNVALGFWHMSRYIQAVEAWKREQRFPSAAE